MRVANWNPGALNEFKGVAYDRLLTASYVVKDKTVQKLRGKIRFAINRPIYRKGPYAGEPWTARHAGELLHSVRVVQEKEVMEMMSEAARYSSMGLSLRADSLTADFVNVRVYAGNYLAYYADIFEFSEPFMRPAFNESMSEVKAICGV